MALLGGRVEIGDQPLVDQLAIRAELRRRLLCGDRFAGGTGDNSVCLTARR